VERTFYLPATQRTRVETTPLLWLRLGRARNGSRAPKSRSSYATGRVLPGSKRAYPIVAGGVASKRVQRKKDLMSDFNLIVVIILLVLVFGGGGGYYWGNRRR